ncbi:MAG: glycosyltransferase family 4 protein [Longimicrobiales bacterium]
MRVLYVVSAFARDEHDVITPWLAQSLARLRARGVDAEVLAPAYRGLADQEIDGIPVHRFRYAPARFEDLTHDQTAPDRVRERPAYLGLVPGYVAAGAAAAVRLARSRRFDLVHVHWPIPHALIGMAARTAGRIPLILSFHGVELTWTRGQLRPLRPLLRRMIRTADGVTANSSYTVRLIRMIHDRPIARIPFGATIEPPAEHAREAAPQAGRLNLLFVGRLVERKGVRHLLDALARIEPARRPHLHIVGEGPLRAELETQSRALALTGDVAFHGFVPPDTLAAHLGAADVFVLPAVFDEKGDTEGLGVVLVEALGHGVPAIASDVGGIPDVVRHERTGLLVPPGDSEALRRSILRLADDPALAHRLGKEGRLHVSREFAWPAITDRLILLYRDVVSAWHDRHSRASASLEDT